MAFDPTPFRKYYIASFWPEGHADEEGLRVLTTDDGIHVFEITTAYTPASSTGAVRNPAIIMRGDTMLLGHSDWSINDDTDAAHISFASSTDGQTFTPLTRPDFTSRGPFSSDPMIWAGCWFDDGADLHYVFSAFPSGSNFDDVAIYYTTATDPDDLTQGFSDPVILAGTAITTALAAGGIYDPQLIKDGTDYYLVCLEVTAGAPANRDVIVFKSTSGPFTGYNTLVNSGNWNGFGAVENDQPLIVTINGETFMYSDTQNLNMKWARQLTGDWKTGTSTWSSLDNMHPTNVEGDQVGAMSILQTPNWTDRSVTPGTPTIGHSGTGATGVTTLSPSLAVTSGDLVVLAIRSVDTITVSSVTAGARVPSYTLITSDVTGDPHVWLYWGVATSTGTETPTVNFSGSTTFSWAALIGSSPGTGTWGTGTLGAHVARFAETGTGVTDLQAGILSTAYAKELVIAAGSQANFASYTAGSGFTLIDGTIGGEGSDFGFAEQQITSSPLTQYDAHVTSTVSDRYAMVVASFKSLSSGAVIPVFMAQYRQRWN